MREGLGLQKKFQPGRYRELYHFIEAGLVGQTRRILCAQYAGFKLQVANRRERGWRRDRGAARVGFLRPGHGRKKKQL